MRSRTLFGRLIAGVIAASLALSVAPVWAIDSGGTITNDAIVAGVRLQGLTADEARAAIAASLTVPPLAPLSAKAGVASFSLDASRMVTVDVEAIVARAFEPTSTSPLVIAPSYLVDPAAVTSWVKGVALKTDRAAVNAKRAVRSRRLVFTRSVDGVRLDTTASVTAVSNALLAQAAAGGAAGPVVTLPQIVVTPKITTASLGKTIVVVLGTRRVTLYKVGGATEKSYRCAIGMARYPTPRGTFRIIMKRKLPSWGNPGSSWAHGMPRYIKPGPNNPLGTRALYLNASGIRIHGTNKTRSIGTAASHGCMRLTNRNIEDLFPRVPVGTTVYIVK
ncbi:MAG: L,D-transpeptidase family protein [Coriobacteriia bacterium]|nr:L,D-transpeptidase family protein [Coriobacteriia bacterium]